MRPVLKEQDDGGDGSCRSGRVTAREVARAGRNETVENLGRLAEHSSPARRGEKEEPLPPVPGCEQGEDENREEQRPSLPAEREQVVHRELESLCVLEEPLAEIVLPSGRIDQKRPGEQRRVDGAGPDRGQDEWEARRSAYHASVCSRPSARVTRGS